MTSEAKVVLTAEDRMSPVLGKAGSSVDKLGGSLQGLGSMAAGALAGFGIAAAVESVVSTIKDTFNASREAIDQIKDLAEASGSSVEKVSALDRVARETGASIDTVGAALVKFNNALNGAEPDAGTGAVLKALNLDIDELKKLDPAEAVFRVSKALDGFADNGEKARAVQILFGKSVREVGPFLKDLAESAQLVGTVTAAQAEEVDKFNKELFRLQANSADTRRALTIDLITALNQVTEAFRSGTRAGRGFLDVAAELYSNNVASFWQKMGIGSGPKKPNTGVYTGSWDTTPEGSWGDPIKQKPSLNIPKLPKSGGGAAKNPYSEAERYLESLRKQLQTTQELTAYEKVLDDLRIGALGATTPALEEKLKYTARMIDADKELAKIEKEYAKVAEEAKKKQEELKAAGVKTFEETRTPLELLNTELEKLQKLLDAGVIDFDTFARKSFDLEEKLRKIPEKSISEMDQFAKNAAENIQEYLGSAFQQLMEGNFSNIGDAFTKMINRMVAEAAAAQLARYLFGDMVKGGSGSGVLSGLMGSIGNAIFGGARASGGPVQSGRGYIVGESGPEWFEPRSSGVIVPNHALGGSTTMVTNHFALTGAVDRRTQAQIAAMAGMGVQRALARNT